MASNSFEKPSQIRLRGSLETVSDSHIHNRSRELNIDPLLVRLLVGRGIESLDEQRSFLNPRLQNLSIPTAMAGYAESIDLLLAARRNKWRVGVFGDYDVDGVTTTTILTTFLEDIGVDVVPHVASREGGYGFNPEAAKSLQQAGVDMVLTGDCGTSDHESISLLNGYGIPTVVIDHHQVPETMPPAAALLNPHQPGCEFPFKGLCSAGVGFYLVAGLRSAIVKAEPSTKTSLPDPRRWLDLVALGTVCDMMPLIGDNRVLVRHGLDLMDQRKRPGVRELLRRARVDTRTQVDETHLGFALGPRLNAPGRLGSAESSLELLRSRSGAEAEALAVTVEACNVERRTLQDQIVSEAMAILEADPRTPHRSGIVVAREGWAPGIVGIAASGIVERYRRPTLVLAIDSKLGEARGSARTAGPVDVRAALAECGNLLRRFGGHKAAAGVSLDASRVPELVEAFDRACAVQIGDDPDLRFEEAIDGELYFRQLDLGFLSKMESLGPYGIGFVRPRYMCSSAEVVSVRVIKGLHLAMRLRQGLNEIDTIAFRMGDAPVRHGSRVGFMFTPSRNTYAGRESVQLIIDNLWKD
jgi:single-stranded-DNA-specific exonuclease